MADQRKFLDFLDMVDGGGAGAMGDKFEGGGIFSALANAVSTPYGSEDAERKAARMKAFGLLTDQGQVGGGSAPTPPKVINSAPDYATMSYGEAGRGAEPAFDPRNFAPNTEPTFSSGTEPPAFDPRNFAPNTQPTFSSGTMPSSVGQSGSAMNMPYNNQQGIAGYNMPQMDVFQQATKSLADELGNSFYMMPQQEQLMRIQQRVDMMRGM